MKLVEERRRLVERGLADGHDITAVARKPEAITYATDAALAKTIQTVGH